MRGIEVFCERCGARQPLERRENAASGATLARRLRSAVTGANADDKRLSSDNIFLRLCLECRGYSCPDCWNNAAGVCQTCAPLPEPEIVAVPEVLAPVELPIVYADTPLFVAQAEPAPEPYVVPEPVVVVAAEPAPAPYVEPEPEPEPVAPPPPPPTPISRPTVTQLPPPPIVQPVPLPLAAAPAPARPSDPVMPAPVVVPRPRPQAPFESPAVAAAVPMPWTQPPPPPPFRAVSAPLPPVATPVQAAAAQPYYLPVPGRQTSQSVGVRPCRNCNLSVSAKAHFCRRCGTAQLAS